MTKAPRLGEFGPNIRAGEGSVVPFHGLDDPTPMPGQFGQRAERPDDQDWTKVGLEPRLAGLEIPTVAARGGRPLHIVE